MSLFKKYTFKGGVHPDDGKEFSAEKSIERMPVPSMVYIPIQQHIGAPAKEIVKAGDVVKAGDTIAEASGFVSTPIHSSINGTVKKIADHPSPIGRKLKTIIIEKDDTEEEEFKVSEPNLDKLSPKELIKLISEAGIVGMGGATFPTHVKLSPPPDKKIEHLLINSAECEPFLTCDYRLMLEKADELYKGVKILQKALGVSKVYIGIEKNKPLAIQKLKNDIKDSDIEIIPLEVKYPQGAEKQLIYAILKKEVPSGGLPMDVGAVVQNTGTAIAVYEALYMKKPLIERVLTVSGPGINEAKNLLVRIGTPIEEVINFCGGLKGKVTKIINGGPMMGISLHDPQAPVIKGSSGLLAFTDKEAQAYVEQPCISCGGCVDICPMSLVPTMIIKNTKKDNWDESERYGAMDCIECGSCAYVCPAKINLVHYIRYAKSEIVALKRSGQTKKGA